MLRYSADRRTLAIVATWFGLVALQWSLPSVHWALSLGLFGLTCWMSFFCAVATHNSVHVPVFVRRAHNAVFQVVLTLTYGHPVSAFVPGHNLSHHVHTQTPRDAMRTSKARFRFHLLNVLLFHAQVGGGVMRGNLRYFRAMASERPRWFAQLMLETSALVVVCAALAWLDWQKFVLFVLLPHQYAAWGIMAINLLQHDGTDARHPWNHSRNFVGRLVNWWTFNNGYHTIHHMRPGVHWSLLPALHRRVVAPHIHPALDQRSLVVYLVRTFLLPGGRKRYDGAPVVLPDVEVDGDWVPASRAGGEANSDTFGANDALGAVA
ncbi:MAG: fatty acid desaturase [Myxococcota bacterium]